MTRANRTRKITLNPSSPSHAIRQYNADAWDTAVIRGSQWTLPVSPEVIASARQGQWEIRLTPEKPVPASWFPPLAGIDLLCLAGGGGQQAPILAATGARVTVLDNSPRQLARDREVAMREGLEIQTVEGDMCDLSPFPDKVFDLIIHPCSNMFVPDVHPVWRECFRVLRPGGRLLAGFCNPVRYIFDQFAQDEGKLVVCHQLPYSDLTSLPPEERQRLIDERQPFEFSHTLEDQIGGQLAAGFVITGFYEDRWSEMVLDQYTATFIVTNAQKST